MSDEPNTNAAQPARLECRPSADTAVRWFIFAGMMLGASVWCYMDRTSPPAAWDMKHINEISSYLFNNWGPFLFAPVGVFAIIMAVRHLSRKCVADAEGIRYGGQKAAWKEITLLDASRLTKGGIVLHYGLDEMIKLKSWDLQNFKDLVAMIERSVPADVQRVSPKAED